MSVDATDADGLSALHYAARAGGVGCVRALLAAAADRSLPSLAGKTAADLTGSREAREALRATCPGHVLDMSETCPAGARGAARERRARTQAGALLVGRPAAAA